MKKQTANKFIEDRALTQDTNDNDEIDLFSSVTNDLSMTSERTYLLTAYALLFIFRL